MQVPWIRGSSEATAATTKLAKSMLLVNRPRFCDVQQRLFSGVPLGPRGTLPDSMPVSTPA